MSLARSPAIALVLAIHCMVQRPILTMQGFGQHEPATAVRSSRQLLVQALSRPRPNADCSGIISPPASPQYDHAAMEVCEQTWRASIQREANNLARDWLRSSMGRKLCGGKLDSQPPCRCTVAPVVPRRPPSPLATPPRASPATLRIIARYRASFYRKFEQYYDIRCN